eukprot:TRINITY_DN22453_c0_g1_i1.p1 TRINITY_DN22453_c0_g1~~TRINITY_DN22453_c0_g1_i1.p1  ORF type:complete len:292 (-),score=45.69 TRINITY_DN22453_c0_g1_i1:351-1226(-)
MGAVESAACCRPESPGWRMGRSCRSPHEDEDLYDHFNRDSIQNDSDEQGLGSDVDSYDLPFMDDAINFDNMSEHTGESSRYGAPTRSTSCSSSGAEWYDDADWADSRYSTSADSFHTVILDTNGGNRPTGVQFEMPGNEDFIVIAVDSGAATDWNKANPELPLLVGDKIIQVNGHGLDDKEAMLARWNSDGILELHVTPGELSQYNMRAVSKRDDHVDEFIDRKVNADLSSPVKLTQLQPSWKPLIELSERLSLDSEPAPPEAVDPMMLSALRSAIRKTSHKAMVFSDVLR